MKTDRREARARLRRGSPARFDAEAYKQRNTAERAINNLKAFRTFAMRTDKREFVYQGTIDVVSIKIWLREPVSKIHRQGLTRLDSDRPLWNDALLMSVLDPGGP